MHKVKWCLYYYYTNSLNGKIMHSIIYVFFSFLAFIKKSRVFSNSCDVHCIFYRLLLTIWKWRWKMRCIALIREICMKNSTDKLSLNPERIGDWDWKCGGRPPRLTHHCIQNHSQQGWEHWGWHEWGHDPQPDKINTHWLEISKTTPLLKNPTAEQTTLKSSFLQPRGEAVYPTLFPTLFTEANALRKERPESGSVLSLCIPWPWGWDWPETGTYFFDATMVRSAFTLPCCPVLVNFPVISHRMLRHRFYRGLSSSQFCFRERL